MLYATFLHRKKVALEVNTTTVEAPAETIAIEKPLITFLDPRRGAESGAVTIIEYGDYACPYCKEFKKVLDRFMTEHPDKVTFIWKSLPSSLYPGSDIAAEAAFCAGDQDKFWPYHDLLFEESPVFDHTRLTFLANDLGLDLTRFGQCLTSRDKKPIVDRSITEAEGLSIEGVPFFFINGQRHEGQLSYEQLLEATTR